MGKPIVRRVAAILCVCCAAPGPGAALAQRAGSTWVTLGWAHIDPRSSSGPSTLIEVAGQPTSQPDPGSGVRVRSARTPVFSFEHYLTDQVSAQFALGLPPKHRLEGTGTLAPVGVIGDGKHYSPALIVKYHFFDGPVRPFLGLGVNYTWYRDNRVTNDAFRSAVYGPQSHLKVSASPSWNPVYDIGIDWTFADGWAIGLAIAHTPLKTRIVVAASETALGVPYKVATDVRLRTVAAGFNVAYRFR